MIAKIVPGVSVPMLAKRDDVVTSLEQSGLLPFATIETRRRCYPLKLFVNLNAPSSGLHVEVNVDVDRVTYHPDHQRGVSGKNSIEECKKLEYGLGEVELKSFIPKEYDPADVMMSVCKELNIDMDHQPRGKVEEYLMRFRPFHFDKCFSK